MPECYEVVRMANYLSDHGLIGSKINAFQFKNRGERLLKHIDPDRFLRRIKHQSIHDIQTKSKFTFLQLDSDVIEWHYRFTGIPHLEDIPYNDRLNSIYSLPITPKDPNQYCRFTMIMDTGSVLHYIDTRCLSTLTLYSDCIISETSRFHSLPDDISSTQHLVRNELRKRPNMSIKLFLQSPVTTPSGIGNYLACEICAYANIHPNTSVRSLSNKHFKVLDESMNQIHCFSQSTATYEWFRVFNRDTCKVCKTPVLKEKFMPHHQTSHWCPNCQPI